jgi:hypothetical protein
VTMEIVGDNTKWEAHGTGRGKGCVAVVLTSTAVAGQHKGVPLAGAADCLWTLEPQRAPGGPRPSPPRRGAATGGKRPQRGVGRASSFQSETGETSSPAAALF